MVPMDKYMSDLNSGQSWYRPTDMLVLVMKDARLPLQLQESFKDRYAKYYAHEIRYDKTFSPCTAQIVDPLREAGWKYPEQGGTPSLIARLVSKLVGPKDPKENRDLYDLLRQEPTHLFPRRVQGLGGDVLSLAGAYGADMLGRELSPRARAAGGPGRRPLRAPADFVEPQLAATRRAGSSTTTPRRATARSGRPCTSRALTRRRTSGRQNSRRCEIGCWRSGPLAGVVRES